jgi:hypothetical protein
MIDGVVRRVNEVPNDECSVITQTPFDSYKRHNSNLSVHSYIMFIYVISVAVCFFDVLLLLWIKKTTTYIQGGLRFCQLIDFHSVHTMTSFPTKVN